jgi:hypothetical protein
MTMISNHQPATVLTVNTSVVDDSVDGHAIERGASSR